MTRPKRKPAKKITAKNKDLSPATRFVRPMGVPCVDLNIERRTPTPRLRYYVATALLAIARVCRRLAYRIASGIAL